MNDTQTPSREALSVLLGSPEFFSDAQSEAVTQSPNGHFIDRLANVLHMTINLQLLAELDNGTISRQGAALEVLKLANFQKILGSYEALLHRPFGPSDEAFVSSLLRSGVDLRSARLIIESSPEFFLNG